MIELKLAFRIDSTLEPRRLEIPIRWLEHIDATQAANRPQNWPMIQKFFLDRDRVLHSTPGKEYDWDAQQQFDEKEFYKLPQSEMDTIWDIVGPRLYSDGGLNFVDELLIPLELESILTKIRTNGPHRVIALSAELDILATMLSPIAEQLADQNQLYDPNILVKVLKGRANFRF